MSRITILTYRGASTSLYGTLVVIESTTLEEALEEIQSALDTTTGILIISTFTLGILQELITMADSLGWIVIIPK